MHDAKYLEKFIWDLMNQNCRDVSSGKIPNSNKSVGIEFAFILQILLKFLSQAVPQLLTLER